MTLDIFDAIPTMPVQVAGFTVQGPSLDGGASASKTTGNKKGRWGERLREEENNWKKVDQMADQPDPLSVLRSMFWLGVLI